VTGTAADIARDRREIGTSAYPRLLRVFTASLVVAILCGFTAVATEGSKGLHPAPFLTLAALCLASALLAFLSMLVGLLAECVLLLRKRRGAKAASCRALPTSSPAAPAAGETAGARR